MYDKKQLHRSMTVEEARVMTALAELMDAGVTPRTVLETLSRLSPPTAVEAAQTEKLVPGGRVGDIGFCYPAGPDMVIERTYITGTFTMLAWAIVPMVDTLENQTAIAEARSDPGY